MSNEIEFTDNSKQIKGALYNVSDQAIEAAMLILQAQIKSNAPVETGELRDSINYRTQRQGETIWGEVGSPLKYAIYVEYGTGEFAENGAGRKGGWAYQDSSGEWFFTWGQSPTKFMRKAFRTKHNQVEEIIGQKFRSSFSKG